MWPPPDRLLARGPEGAFVHDLVVPLLGPHRRPPTARPDPVRRADRLRPIGSDWLTLKLFGGRTTCDRLLVEAVAPAIAALSEAGAVDRWFFHRVSDPDAHLVVRLHGPPDRMPREAPQAIAGALAPLEAIGRTRPSVLEPYAREVARYGGAAGVALAEAIFCADSGAVCELLALIDPGDDDARFLIALRGADQLLHDLGLDAAGKRAAADAARARHFAVSPQLRRLFAAQHRRRRADREAALDRGHEGPYAPAWSVLARRSARIAPVTVELRALEARGALARPLAEQAWSYVHMFVNRLLRAPSLEEERALWDALLRSWAARAPVRGR
jgi:thiopeptide-type bacteriocin biosynthesis protein